MLGLWGRFCPPDLVRQQREANAQAQRWLVAELRAALQPTAPDMGFTGLGLIELLTLEQMRERYPAVSA